MRTALSIIAVTVALLGSAYAADQKHDYKTGKLIDIGTDEAVVKGTQFRFALFTVQVADLIYTARGGRVRRGSGDIGQGLIIGDPAQVAIDGDHLILLKPDGKEMKTTIIKRTRAPSQ